MKLIIKSVLFGVGLAGIIFGVVWVAVEGLLYLFNIDSLTPIYYLLGICALIIAYTYYQEKR